MRRTGEQPPDTDEVDAAPGCCEVCGRQLGGSRDRVVEALAHLARFGLTGQMLLSRRGS
jgi:hypothetical protein